VRVDLPDGTYTLTQEGYGTVDGELNQTSVQQDLDQSPEEPRLVLSQRKANTGVTYNIFGLKAHALLHFSTYVLLCAFKFQELFET
jgi:hypothetical protein